jgi:hypothetical protein
VQLLRIDLELPEQRFPFTFQFFNLCRHSDSFPPTIRQRQDSLLQSPKDLPSGCSMLHNQPFNS